MKLFLIRFFWFCLFLFSIAWILDICITYRLRKSDAYDIRVWDNMIHSRMDNDLLILGSSRAWVQYNPNILDSVLHSNCYNLGRDGKRIDLAKLCYDIYMKYDNSKPEAVIIDFFDATLTVSDPYGGIFMLPYIYEPDIWKCIHKTHNMNWYWKMIPLSKYYARYNQVRKLYKSEYPIYKGYHGFDGDWDGTLFDNIDTIHFYASDTAISILDSLLYECQIDGVKVILVHSPIIDGYMDKIDDTASMWSIYRSFSTKYNIPILDYSDCEICKDTNYFYNARHLNKTGSILFSLKLAHDLDSMGYSFK